MRQTDWNGKPYHSLDYELKKIFGKKSINSPLDGGMTCPNRDGTLGRGGCIFAVPADPVILQKTGRIP